MRLPNFSDFWISVIMDDAQLSDTGQKNLYFLEIYNTKFSNATAAICRRPDVTCLVTSRYEVT